MTQKTHKKIKNPKQSALIVDADFSSPNLAMHFGLLKPLKRYPRVPGKPFKRE